NFERAMHNITKAKVSAIKPRPIMIKPGLNDNSVNENTPPARAWTMKRESPLTPFKKLYTQPAKKSIIIIQT
ncbi:MAG: hypothetical protein II732_09015, partial [Lachnospiraceae bacterium]|nr:hypothetical protein [Lachnospiraceae bacterium]